MSASAPNAYSYEPVGESSFRILELYPGQPSDPLRGKLHVCHGDPEQHNYECVSYTWGSSELIRSIELGGTMLSITTHLHDLLEDFRLSPGNSQPISKHHTQKATKKVEPRQVQDLPTSGSRYLWVDGICINQTDDDEKSFQVSRMASYYMAANCVLVHFGRKHMGGQRFLDFIADFKLFPEENLSLETFKNVDIRLKQTLFNSKYDSSIFDELEKVTTAAYWRRCWIVQELALASSVFIYCTSTFITFKDLLNAAFWALKLDKSLGIWSDAAFRRTRGITTIHNLGALRSPKGERLPKERALITLLMIYSSHDATDPRDKLYSLIGLVSEPVEDFRVTDDIGIFKESRRRQVVSHRHEFEGQYQARPTWSHSLRIDYRESVSACYLRCARNLVCWYESNKVLILNILYKSSCGTRKDLPSWVPDWSTTNSQAHLYAPLSSRFILWSSGWHAAATSTPYIQLTDCPNHLNIRGFVLDTLTKIGHAEIGDRRSLYLHSESLQPAPWEGVRVLHEIRQLLGDDCSCNYLSALDIDKIVMKTVFLGKEIKSANSKAFLSDLEIYLELTSQQNIEAATSTMAYSMINLDFEGRLPVSQDFPVHLQDFCEYNSMIAPIIKEWHPCLTSRHRIGLVPGKSEVGDTIFLPLGSNVPFIMRQCGEDNEWVVIGDCYIDGIMKGEINERDWEVHEVTLA